MPGSKKYKILFIALSFLSITALAQSPGYLGKKIAVGYGFYFNPAFTAAILDYGTYILNTQHEFFGEAVIKRTISMGLSAKIYRTTYNNTGETEPQPLENTDFLAKDPTGQLHIKARNYSLYFKFYKQNYLAPWGRYFLLGIAYVNYKSTYNPDEMYIPTETYEYHNWNKVVTSSGRFNKFGATTREFQYVDVMMGNGNSRIFKNKIVVDYGYNINLIATTLVFADAFDNLRPYYSSYVENKSKLRVRGINRFNFFVKVGYLF